MNSDFRVDAVSSGTLDVLQQNSYRLGDSSPGPSASLNRSPRSDRKLKLVVCGDGGVGSFMVEHANKTSFGWEYTANEIIVPQNTESLPTSEPKSKTKKPKIASELGPLDE